MYLAGNRWQANYWFSMLKTAGLAFHCRRSAKSCAVTVSPVANAPNVVMGVINLRGQVVVVLDARRLLNFPEKKIVHTDHLIVVDIEGRLLATRVDRASDLAAVDEEEFQSVNATNAVARAEHQFAQTSAGLVHVVDLIRCIDEVETALPSAGPVSSGPEATP